MLSRIERCSSEVSCVTIAIWARRLSCVTVAMSWPSIRMRPFFEIVKPQQQVDEGRFAGARGADETDALAGRHGEVDAVQHTSRGAVAEPDPLEPYRASRRPAARPHRAGPASGAAPRSTAFPPARRRYSRRSSSTFCATQPAIAAMCQVSGNAIATVPTGMTAVVPQPDRNRPRCRRPMLAFSAARVSPSVVVSRSCARNASVRSSIAARTNSSSSRGRAKSLTVWMLV